LGERGESITRMDAWHRLQVGRLLRTPHVRRCIRCKELADMMAGTDDDDYVEDAVQAVREHAGSLPMPDNVACRYSGCIHHEDLPNPLAMKVIELGRGDMPWRDLHGVKVSNIALRVREEDAPEGWDFKAHRADVMSRHFVELPKSAGDIFVRFGPKRTTAHVWISPAYATRHETVEDAATIEDVISTCDRTVPSLKAWCMSKFRALRELARMEQWADPP